MVQAFSRLKRVLQNQNMTVPQLHQRIAQEGLRVNVKSLYRLNNDQEPLHRLDLRVAAAICQVFTLPLSELITFETTPGKLRRLSGAKQKRLDSLMSKNNEGLLTSTERRELQALVQEAEEIMQNNARYLAGQRKKLELP